MANMQDAYDNTGGELQRDIKQLLGWHESVIIMTERTASNAKGNQQLHLKFKVTEIGEFEGRECSTFLSLWNSSDKAKEIANRDLNSICAAAGVLRSKLSDSDMLIGIPMMVNFGKQKDKPEYSEPKNYKPLNGAAGHRAGGGDAGQSSQEAAWRRRA